MRLAHWDPFRSLRHREDAFEDFVREFFGRAEGSDVIEPPIEVAESNGDVIVKMIVPGVEKDQIQISVVDNVLTASGEVRKEKEEKK
ncbi:MAG: Hsp20 family protein, partial [Candidatus Binatia bacterium]